jgi:pimeloyl-ACP methyl ester carboxylesterase
MKVKSDDVRGNIRFRCQTTTKLLLTLTGCLVLLFLTVGDVQAKTQWPRVVFSKDGTSVSYEIYGSGEPTLVFVHGWSCDARYWRAQVPHFAKKHRVVILDLAGHGHSGLSRTKYAMAAFGEDVLAVTEAVGSPRVILIGHSMGGSVIAEAARLMPDRVIGLIGIDTFDNIEYPLTSEELKKMTTPWRRIFNPEAGSLSGGSFLDDESS